MNIKEAAEKSGVSADTIRYYEKIGLITPIDRTSGGIRDIGERTLGRISFVRSMRNAGMSIESLKTYISLVDDQVDHREAQIELLKEQRTLMIEKRDDIQFAIDHLAYKIEHYDDHMAEAEKRLKELERQHKELRKGEND